MKKKPAIIHPNFFAKKPPPYHDILNADFPPALSLDEIVAEVEQRNTKVRFAQSVEKAVLAALEEGRLPALEKRLAKEMLGRLIEKLGTDSA